MESKPVTWEANSLKTMAMKVVMRNVAGIVGVADMKYDLVRPLLQRIANPKQLQQIEANSPHIARSSAELWIAFIERDIPDWRSKVKDPNGPHRWSKLYWDLLRADKKAQFEQEQRLEASLKAATAAEVAKKPSAQFVPQVTPTILRKQDLLDAKRSTTRSSWPSASVSVSRAPALKNARTGSEAIAAIRRQAKCSAKFKTCGVKGQNNAATRPVSQARRTRRTTSKAEKLLERLEAYEEFLADPMKNCVWKNKPHKETREERMLRTALEAEKVKQDAAQKRHAEIVEAREKAEARAAEKAIQDTGKLVDLTTPIEKGASRVRTPKRTPSSTPSKAASMSASPCKAASISASSSGSVGPSLAGLFSPSGSTSPLKTLPSVPSAGRAPLFHSGKLQQGTSTARGPIVPPSTVAETTDHGVDLLAHSANLPLHNGNAPPRKRPAVNIFMPTQNKKRRT